MSKPSKLTKNQVRTTDWKTYTEHSQRYRIRATIRYDDSCGNGHNSFSITGETQRIGRLGLADRCQKEC